jgi:hypothetical protein
LKKQQRKFVKAVEDLDSAILAKRIERGGGRRQADLTKEEFAALEWLYYYFCSGRLTKPQEIWDWRFTEVTYFNMAEEILSKIIVATGKHIDAFSPDEKKIQRVRMAWAAVLLRKFKVWYSEFEEEKIAIKSRARYYEFTVDFHKRHRDTLLGDMTKETEYRLSEESHAYNDIAICMGKVKAALESEIPWFEDSFLTHLLWYFGDDFQSIDLYIKMAGYETETDRAMLFSNTKEGLMKSSWTAGIFENYINRKKLNFKRFENIVISERKAKNEKLKRLEHKWKVIAAKNRIEYDKVIKAYFEAKRKKHGEPEGGQ